jgi:hypothetical protein
MCKRNLPLCGTWAAAADVVGSWAYRECAMSLPVAVYAFGYAFELTPAVLTVVAVVGIALMGVAWFAIKFWLASTRPADIKEVQTPKLDQLNREALEAMGDDEEEDEEAPEGLKDVVEEPGEKRD